MSRPRAPRGVAAVLTASLACLPGGCGCDVEPVVQQTVALRLLPDDVDFGVVPVAAAAERSVVIANNGSAPWVPKAPPVVEGEGLALVDGCAAPVGPGETCTARLVFTPLREGAHIGSVRVVYPGVDGDATVSAALRGTGGPATLTLSPAVIDFGDVAVGGSRAAIAILENRANVPVRVPLVVEGPGFLLDGGRREASVDLGSAARVEVPLLFSPTTGAPATGRLVAAVCGAGCGPAIALTGTANAPRVDATPRSLDIGAVAVGDTGAASLTLTNVGTGPLQIDAIDVEGGGAAFAVEVDPPPLVLAPGDDVVVDVVFAPTQGVGDSGATLVVRSNDPVSPEVFVPINATSPGPGVDVIPVTGHLGFLDPAASRALSILIRSTGDAPITLRTVDVLGNDDDAFALEDAPAPGPLPPRHSALFRVRGTATPAAIAAGGATARVVLDFAEVPDREVAVAFAAGTSGCVPRPVVGAVQLGGVRLGQGASGVALVQNVGDAPCTAGRAATVPGLPADAGMTFRAENERVLAPGDTAQVVFGFSPVVAAPASIVVGLSFAETAAPVLVSAAGRGVRGGLVGAPAAVALGPAPRGCGNPTAPAVFFNDGAASVTVDAVTLEPPDAPFTVQTPTPPLTLLPGASFPVSVTARVDRAPDGLSVAGVVAHSEDGGDARIALSLEVVLASVRVEETFVAADVDAVDILFVIDNSGSMADDQRLLADNFAAFFSAALDDHTIDFQLGVTTTDVLSPGAQRGALVGTPAFIDGGTPDLEGEFARRVVVGVEGTGIELGLEAMRLALEHPDNRGFVRADAALSVVFVTDEEDAGAFPEILPDPALGRSPDEYVALLESTKAGAVHNAPVLVSAVLQPGGAPRYEALVRHFGGSVLDITTPDWGARLGEIGVDTFTLARTFVLSADALPSSIVVEINGIPTTAFVYDAARRAVILDEAPGGGAEIVIRYDTRCI